MNAKYDILIAGGILTSMSEDMGIIENPVIGICNGRIELIDSLASGAVPDYRAKETIDATGCLIMPGLVNTHTHLPMVCFRGMADDLPLMDWLQNHIWPAEAKHVNPEMVYAGAMLAMAEMVLSGTTTFCDAYFHESSVARAALDAGMRGIVCEGVLDLPKPHDPTEIAETAMRFIEKWQGKSPLLIPGIMCHSPYTCTSETLIAIKEVTRKTGVPYTIHVSETTEEVSIIRERYGKKPVFYLRDLDVLDSLTVAVHCNWLEEDEMDILGELNVKVSHNPESSLKLAAGIAPIPKLLRKGVVVGLGTDGAASNNNHDLFGEMATAARIHKVSEMDPTVMDAETVLKIATIDGAQALGLEKIIGSIEPGKCADLIILDSNRPHWVPLYNPYSQLVYAASGADVIHSIINGRIVMRDRTLLTMDLPVIMKEVKKIATAITKNL